MLARHGVNTADLAGLWRRSRLVLRLKELLHCIHFLTVINETWLLPARKSEIIEISYASDGDHKAQPEVRAVDENNYRASGYTVVTSAKPKNKPRCSENGLMSESP
jgi:hypothetical protein